MTARPLSLTLAMVLATACGKSAAEKPFARARSHAATSPILYDVVDLSGDLGNGLPLRIGDDGILIGTA